MAIAGHLVRAQHTPSYYRLKREQLQRHGAIKKRHADTTKVNMHGVKEKWTRHCEHLSVNPIDHLQGSTKEDVMTFLEWMLDSHSKIRKRSTVHAYKRILFQVYRKSVGLDFDRISNEEINDFINGYLTVRYNLDTSVNEKPVMDVDDVYLVQHHHWVHDTSVFPDERQRIQLAFLVLLQAYTATRPRVLAYKKLSKTAIDNHYFEGDDKEKDDQSNDKFDPEEDDFKTICYRDIQLLLLKNPEGGRDLPAMEVTLRYTKGWERRENPKTFIFYEVDDLLFDAVLHMLAIALLDEAFEAKIRGVDDFYRVRVRPPRHSLEFRWRESIRNTPVFRQALPGSNGTVHTSSHEALRYHTYLYYLQRLGSVTGFMQILNPYCIRRGSGEAVESVATQAQLQQVMCHINAATYQAYINQRIQCDTAAAFLGRPSNQALLKAAGHMSRYVDPRAPTSASPGELEKVRTDPTLVSLTTLRDSLSQEVRRESGTIQDARKADTKLYHMYRTVEDKVRSTRCYLRKLAKASTRQDFFNTINTTEINYQLQDESHTFLDLAPEDWQPKASYGLEERKLLSELICTDTTRLDDDTKLKHRMITTNTMVLLGNKTEFRSPKENIKAAIDPFPETCDTYQCFMCFWNEDIPSSKRLHKFFSVQRTRDHLVSQHLKCAWPIVCPKPECRESKVLLYGHQQVQSHLTRAHQYDVFRRYKGLGQV